LELASTSALSRQAGKGERETEWKHSTPPTGYRDPASKTERIPVVTPTDLKRLYGRFAVILVGSIVVVSAGFGTALYFVAKDRAKLASALAVRTNGVTPETRERQSLQAAKEKEEENRRLDFRQRMIQGGVALGNHHFEDAVKEYKEALQLFPDDVEAAKGLSAARTSLEDQARVKKDEDKRQVEFTRLMSQGKDAMKNQQFADAAMAFDNALRLIPENAAAAKAYREASDALDAQQLAKKKAADYESHMTAARAAMVGQRYADARNEFLAALQQKPQDEAATNGRKLAETRLNELRDEEKRRADFNQFMDQGDRALRNRRYEEAERAYTKAVNLLPRDLDARNGLKEAQKGLEKIKQDFIRLVGQGDLAMQTARYGDAVRAYKQATKLIPDNDAANDKLQAAQKALDDLNNAQATYNRLMLQGATAMRLGRFGDATLAYSAALRVAPGDLDALAGLRSARGAMFGPSFIPIFP
jgi:cytochrome c-type biogenesis protein CcmH/NrfG